MTVWQTVALGAGAGITVYLGLPVARLRNRVEAHSFLTSLALGALLLAIWEILSRGLAPVDDALHTGMTSGRWLLFSSLALMLAFGLILGLVGLASLVSFRTTPSAEGAAIRLTCSMRMHPSQLAVIIATGLGVHNFSEGLAISHAAAGSPASAVSLVVGLGVYNLTQGLAIAAPLAFAEGPPPWSFLGVAGLIAGGPALLGTLLGYQIRSPEASVFFLALGAGALFFVIGELFAVSRRFKQPLWSVWGILIGFLAAYGVDLAFSVSRV